MTDQSSSKEVHEIWESMRRRGFSLEERLEYGRKHGLIPEEPRAMPLVSEDDRPTPGQKIEVVRVGPDGKTEHAG